MKWFRLYAEIKDDPKMLELDDAQFRTWINLLAMASEADERGVIPAHRPRGLAAALHATVENMETAFALFAEIGMIERREDGSLLLTNFMERQYDNPSDRPEKVAERKARLKERQQNAPETTAEAPAQTENDKRTTEERQKNDTYSDTDSDTDTEAENTQCVKKHTAAVRERAKPSDFDAFWKVYPNKQAKDDAWKSWQKLNPDAALMEILMAAVLRAKACDQWQRGIIPHPTTWLNQKRWTDELPAKNLTYGNRNEIPSARSVTAAAPLQQSVATRNRLRREAAAHEEAAGPPG